MYNEDFVNIIVWIVSHVVAILNLTTAPQVETTLYHLPRPTKHHIDCLDNLLANLEHDYGLDQEQVDNRALTKLFGHKMEFTNLIDITCHTTGISHPLPT